jgi:phosphomannomutase
MALKFGTSGVRGLVSEMTDRACHLYTRAFAQHLSAMAPGARRVSLAGDLRSSTPRIMRAVAAALTDEGLDVDCCGNISTPAVTLHGLRRGQASVMVTGSHIPDDRNGIKLNMPWGEVLKQDEAEISRRAFLLAGEGAGQGSGLRSFTPAGELTAPAADLGPPVVQAAQEYVRRYLDFFPDEPLAGTRVVFYEHSCVCRDLFQQILRGLGAVVVPVGRSDVFVPVDTEAVQDPDRLAAWVAENEADALVSADGDGDRPLVVDERGVVVRGDVLGVLAAEHLGADAVAAPVSCSTALERSKLFCRVTRTRIGSPYVIEAMNAAVDAGCSMVVGYEANGGFLTASEAIAGDRRLAPLPTRDAVLPVIALLLMARTRGHTVSQVVGSLPRRFTWSGLLRGVPAERGAALVERYRDGGPAIAEADFAAALGPIESLDFTDGARMTFLSGDVVHLRPSGNAPELRCYTESDPEARAASNNTKALEVVQSLLPGGGCDQPGSTWLVGATPER